MTRTKRADRNRKLRVVPGVVLLVQSLVFPRTEVTGA
jgi:hypothetical protein